MSEIFDKLAIFLSPKMKEYYDAKREVREDNGMAWMHIVPAAFKRIPTISGRRNRL